MIDRLNRVNKLFTCVVHKIIIGIRKFSSMIFLSTDSHDGKKIALLNMQLYIYLGQSLRKEDGISY
jgi:hypothetical protein